MNPKENLFELPFRLSKDEINNHRVLTACFHRFSKLSSEYGELVSAEYSADDEEFDDYFQPVFYLNGYCKENEGYVSVLFYLSEMIADIDSHIEFGCCVGILDVAGNIRFLQTLTCYDDTNSPSALKSGVPKFGFDNFIKRETLLNDPAELLPNDCLTIHIEIDYVIRFYNLEFDLREVDTFTIDEEKHYIELDSYFGKELCKLSDYFQRASDTPMIENKTRRVCIPKREYLYFLLIIKIFARSSNISTESLAEVCQLYTVAEKYDIQVIIETCRQVIKCFLCRTDDPTILEHVVESIPMILELSEMYKDVRLKDSVEVYLKTKKKFETNHYALKEELNNKLSSEWSCEFEKKTYYGHFKLRRIEGKNPEMEFYK